MYCWVFKKYIYPLHEFLFDRETVKQFQFLVESQFWIKSAHKSHSDNKLRKILKIANKSVPFYQNFANKNGMPIGEINDFQQIPFLERKHLQQNFDELKNLDFKGKVAIQATGGSSGTPVRFCSDTIREASTIALRLRSHRGFNIDIGDKEVVIWGSPIELGRQDWLRTFRDFIFRSRLIYAFNFTDETMQKALKTIIAYKPRKIYGYAQSIHMLAKYYLEEFPGPKRDKLCEVVFTTSEPLFDYQRDEIERAFGAKVAVEYGARDAGLIAHECPQGNMHINAESIYVEIIDENGNVLPAGETGEIVVTNFDTPSMPIIRYRTGDMGMLIDDECSCGVTLPLMKVVGGRMSDFLLGVDGRKIHPLGGIYILREIEDIKKFRIVQNALDQIDLELSVREKLTEDVIRNIQRKFDKLLGCPVKVLLNYKDDIESSASGKFRHVICNISS